MNVKILGQARGKILRMGIKGHGDGIHENLEYIPGLCLGQAGQSVGIDLFQGF